MEGNYTPLQMNLIQVLFAATIDVLTILWLDHHALYTPKLCPNSKFLIKILPCPVQLSNTIKFLQFSTFEWYTQQLIIIWLGLVTLRGGNIWLCLGWYWRSCCDYRRLCVDAEIAWLRILFPIKFNDGCCVIIINWLWLKCFHKLICLVYIVRIMRRERWVNGTLLSIKVFDIIWFARWEKQAS